jgi:phage replication O-like protein O
MSVIDGFAQLPNGMVKRLIELRIAGEEAQVFWVIFQKTIGWHKKWDKIPLSQFVKATGMVKPSICQLINRLKKKNIILVDKDYLDVSNNGNFATQYRINESYYQWQSVHKQHAAVPIIKKHAAVPVIKQHAAVPVIRKHAAVPVNKQHTANPNSRRAATLELPDHWDIAQKMLFFKSFYNALAKWDGTTTSSHGRESTHSLEHKTSTDFAPFFIAFAKILTGVSKTTNKGGSKIPNDPLVKLRHSKEPNQNKPSTKDISSKERGEERGAEVSQLITFAARECKVTVMGDKTKLLEQLVKIHKPDRVKHAFENYKHYLGTNRAGRRFPIGSGIDSFVRKFDTFVDLERVKQRIKDEKRWYSEHKGEKNKGKVTQIKQEEQERVEQTNEQSFRNNFRREFVKDLEEGAKEKGMTVEEMILPDRNLLDKFNMFKRELQELELEAA